MSTTTVTMDISRRLQLLLDIDELKSDTACTRQIVEAIRQLLCLDSDKKLELQQVIERIRHSWVQMLESVKRRRSVTSKLDKLYSEFHKFSVGEGFRMCAATGQAIEIQVPETLWQLLLEKEFTSFLSTKFGTAADTQTQATSRTLTDVEENAVRYMAGYTIRKLRDKHARQASDVSKECVAALQVMAGAIRTDTTEQSSNKWTSMVNRGGLYFVNNVVFDLFVTIESIVDSKLTQILKESGKGIEQVQKENLTWICEDEEVQSIWDDITSNTIEEEEIRQNLLREIAHIWVTTRGHSKTHKIKEDCKKHKKENVKGKRSLRKELERQREEDEH